MAHVVLCYILPCLQGILRRAIKSLTQQKPPPQGWQILSTKATHKCECFHQYSRQISFNNTKDATFGSNFPAKCQFYGFIGQTDRNDNIKYKLYVIQSEEDDWFENHLEPFEVESGFRFYLPSRDSTPGTSLFNDIDHALPYSEKIFMVLSNRLIQDRYFPFFCEMALKDPGKIGIMWSINVPNLIIEPSRKQLIEKLFEARCHIYSSDELDKVKQWLDAT